MYDSLCSNDRKESSVCEQHGQTRNLFCNEHNVAICSHCALFGDHRGHNVVPMEEKVGYSSSVSFLCTRDCVSNLKTLLVENGNREAVEAESGAREDGREGDEEVCKGWTAVTGLLAIVVA